MLTHIRFLSSVGTQVSLQVFQTGVGLGTALKLQEEGVEEENISRLHVKELFICK